jgi:hypothetical protein
MIKLAFRVFVWLYFWSSFLFLSFSLFLSPLQTNMAAAPTKVEIFEIFKKLQSKRDNKAGFPTLQRSLSFCRSSKNSTINFTDFDYSNCLACHLYDKVEILSLPILIIATVLPVISMAKLKYYRYRY